jgi:4-amino-4-deoxy-L-arabinose transferase-like glycosyltransferase
MILKSYNSSLAPFYFLIIGVFIFIISPNLFSDGMFMDGLIYSTVSQNLSEGLGTFWNPTFSQTHLSEFHEHPPLAFGIQSIFYSAFGDSRYIDKIYSILTILLISILVLKIWEHFKLKHGWIPLFLYLITPLIGWTATNNMLENTMSIFTTLSVYFYLKSTENNKYTYIILAGIMLALGFLTKGFFAFFPWSLPFIYWVFIKKTNFKTMFFESIIMVAFTILPLFLLMLISSEAKISLEKYFEIQVVGSLKNVVTVDSRFFILKKLFTELLPAIGIIVLITIMAYRNKLNLTHVKKYQYNLYLFFSLGLTGVLPIMISLKQNGFYIVTALPFFAIAIAFLIYPLIEISMNKINFKSNGFKIFRWFSIFIFVLSIGTSLYFAKSIGRDKDKLEDIYTILPHLKNGCIINMDASLNQDWSLYGYFSRYKNISLDDQLKNNREFLLINKSSYNDSLLLNYENLDLATIELMLLKRKTH